MVNYTEKKVIVKESEIHGYGLFADQMIGSNHSIIEYVGDVVSEDEYEERKEQYEDEGIAEKYIMKLGDDQYIDATINGNDSRYINHSCEVSSNEIVVARSVLPFQSTAKQLCTALQGIRH